MKRRFDRRTMLRGTLAGGAVSMGLPLLDCFLNDHGTALAQGAPLPLRFGAWMWGCGVNPQRWAPATTGEGWTLPPELVALGRELPSGGSVRDHVSVLSGFDVTLDGRPNFPHSGGLVTTITGTVPEQDGQDGRFPTVDSPNPENAASTGTTPATSAAIKATNATRS